MEPSDPAADATLESDAVAWRPEILDRVLSWTALLGGLIAGSYLALTLAAERARAATPSFWLPFVPYAGLLLLQRWRGLAFRARAIAFTGALWLLGLLAAPAVGLGPGPVLTWVLMVVSAGLFLGSRAMLGALVLTTLSALGLGWLEASGLHQIQLGEGRGSLTWVRRAVAFFATTGAIGVLIAHVVHRIESALERSLEEQRERRRAERAREGLIADLEVKNAELERYAYTVSHDLKSPLVTIRGFVELLERDALAGDRARVADDVARISAATERMGNLLHDLLELSRVGRLVNPPEVIDLHRLVADLVEANRPRLEAQQARVELVEPLPAVYADRERLVELVQNLLDNAVTFAGEGAPRVAIGSRGRDADGGVVVFVKDEGSGIPERFHETVFGLFETLGQPGSGTGIGLALAKRIVEVQGGRIWVESEGESRGSTFVFTLPAPRGQS